MSTTPVTPEQQAKLDEINAKLNEAKQLLNEYWVQFYPYEYIKDPNIENTKELSIQRTTDQNKPRMDFFLEHNNPGRGTGQTEEIEPGVNQIYVQEH